MTVSRVGLYFLLQVIIFITILLFMLLVELAPQMCCLGLGSGPRSASRVQSPQKRRVLTAQLRNTAVRLTVGFGRYPAAGVGGVRGNDIGVKWRCCVCIFCASFLSKLKLSLPKLLQLL